MKISEVMIITGLTKKAINYYEEKGLINPSVEINNNYRNYTKEDIERLKEIAVLRSFNLSVKKIKEILISPEKIGSVFKEQLNTLKIQIENMGRCQEILKSCLNNANSISPNIKKVTDDMILLKESLDMNEREKEGYMKKQLMRIFPGFFGKYISLKLSNYLDEPLDSKEKKEAWIHLVKILDNSHDLKVSMESDDINWKLIEKTIKNADKDFYLMNDKGILNYVDHLSDFESSENDVKLCEQLINYIDSNENIKFSNDLLILINKDLKILSLNYKKIQENISKVNDEMEKKYEDLSNFDVHEIGKNIRITILPEMTFVCYEYKRIIPFGKVSKLIENFKNRIKEIDNIINPHKIYTINGIHSLPQYKNSKNSLHKFNFSWIIGVQVPKEVQIPHDMQIFTIPSHKYVWYILKGNRTLKTFIKYEVPLASVIAKSYMMVNFPILELHNYDCNTKELTIYNYTPIE